MEMIVFFFVWLLMWPNRSGPLIYKSYKRYLVCVYVRVCVCECIKSHNFNIVLCIVYIVVYVAIKRSVKRLPVTCQCFWLFHININCMDFCCCVTYFFLFRCLFFVLYLFCYYFMSVCRVCRVCVRCDVRRHTEYVEPIQLLLLLLYLKLPSPHAGLMCTRWLNSNFVFLIGH